MSGHSKWAQIKHKKSATDSKKSRLFSQLSRMITLAAKRGGQDPGMNAALHLAIEKAKQANMPASNIERAIARAGEKNTAMLEEVRYEAYGPGGAALLVEGITDNSNRTSNELKHIVQKHGGKFAEPGAVSWMFTKKTMFTIPVPQNRDALELALIDAGAQDITSADGMLRVVVPPEKSEKMREALASMRVRAESSVTWVARTVVPLNPRQQKDLADICEELKEHDDVQHVYVNVEKF